MGKKKPSAATSRKTTQTAASSPTQQPKCGLCGKTKKLTKTPCCNNWICDDESNYRLFSFAHNSCSRNHDRYTLCSHHDREGHQGDWRKCKKCKKDLETEMYVWYATNEYNFVKLDNPPKYEPTRCVKCNKVIVLTQDAHALAAEGYLCSKCSGFDWSLFGRFR